MTVKELIKRLEKIKNKNLPVRVIAIEDESNYWLDPDGVEVSNTGESGYEISGEVRLIGSE